MTPEQLKAAAEHLIRHQPTAELVRNQVGNLAVMVGGQFVGFVDLSNGLVTLFEHDDTSAT